MTSDSPVAAETDASVHGPKLKTIRNGLRWFLAEFLVVVAGVLVALAVSALWQGRQDREHERLYLQQFDTDLQATENDMRVAQIELTRKALAAAAIVHAFWGERPASDQDLRDDFGIPWGTSRFRPVLGNIDALTTRGNSDVIRSAELRTELVSYVEWSKARLDDIARYDETYYRPGVNELLSRLDPGSLRVDAWRKKNAGMPHAFDLSSIAATGDAPFPVDMTTVFKDRVVYDAYQKIMLAHRNQAAEYGEMLERARRLHGQVYRQMRGVAEPGNCQLESVSGSDFIGTCGTASEPQSDIVGEIRLRLHPVDAISSGRWKIGETPANVKAGKMIVAGVPETDVELETTLLGDGVLRTQSGWFPVRAAEKNEDETRLSFRLDTRHHVSANSMDVAILNETKTLLAEATNWDRRDDRECTSDKPALSLYCALVKATRTQSGGFHHRRPAMEIVRTLVDARSAGRNYEHRLRDYNNDSRTTLADIGKLLDEAIVLANKASD